MRLTDWLSEQRDRQITDHAAPYLDPDEEVLDWVRIRHPERRRDGFAYITARRFIVHWVGKSEGHRAPAWGEIVTWELQRDKKQVPVLCVSTAAGTVSVRLLVSTGGLVERVTRFLARFSELAPRPGISATEEELQVMVEQRSVLAQTKRGVVALIGIALVLAGMLLGPLPVAPGIPLIIAGLAVLASEFDWAKDALVWVKTKYRETTQRFKARSPDESERKLERGADPE